MNGSIDTGGKLTQASSHDLRLPSRPIDNRKLKRPMTPNFAHLRVGTKNERRRRFLQPVFPLGRGGGRWWPTKRGQRGPGRGGNHPECHPHGPGGPRGHISFEDDGDYEFANDGRDYSGSRSMIRRGLNNLEYEARQNAIFQPEGAPPMCNSNAGSTHAGGRGGGQPMPPPAWQGQQGAGQLNPAMPPHDPQGQQGSFLAPIPLGGGATTPPAVPAPQAPAQQLGGARIAVQPPRG